MKIRMKFEKKGLVKFVGHLDTVRLFQRAIKMCNIPIAYSQGFNPHPLTYFAMPLSVGVSSEGEYLEIITKEPVDLEELKEKFNKVLPEGIRIVTCFQVDEKTDSLMSLVHRGDYVITIDKNTMNEADFKKCEAQLAQESLWIMKKGKKKTTEVDIKPLIVHYQLEETPTHYRIEAQLKTGSKANLSPDLLLKAVSSDASEGWSYQIERKELYTEDGEQVIPLCRYGHVH